MAAQIVEFGPRELWLVSNGNWCLPIFCDPYTGDGKNLTHWSVRPAVQLLAAPFAELSSRFAPISLGTSRTFWIIDAEHLDKVATKASGITPEYYLKWESESVDSKEMAGLEIVEPDDKEDEFVKFFCDRAAIDRPIGRYVWRAIKDGLLHWLVGNQKPVSFEVFTIHPIPFRANWKDIMLAKHPTCAPIFRKPRGKWREELLEEGFMEDLGSTDLLSMDHTHKTFNWTLEVVPGKIWTDEMAAVERARMASKRQVEYASYYERCVRRRMEGIIEVFSSWIREVCKPVGAIRESSRSRRPILVSVPKHGQLLGSRQKSTATFLSPPDNKVRLVQGPAGVPARVAKTIARMLELPSVESGEMDLRDGGERAGVDRPSDGGGGASGLPVPDAIEIETQTSRLLDSGDNGS